MGLTAHSSTNKYPFTWRPCEDDIVTFGQTRVNRTFFRHPAIPYVTPQEFAATGARAVTASGGTGRWLPARIVRAAGSRSSGADA